MPTAQKLGITIEHAWVHRSQPDRIHYLLWDGQHGRRLWAGEGSVMFEELYRILQRKGYRGVQHLTRHKMKA